MRLMLLLAEGLRTVRQRTTPVCRQCGVCCEAFGSQLTADRFDLERWRREGRRDLLAMANRLGWLWFDPKTGQRLGRCPFLTRVDDDTMRCAIQETKPRMCRAYPTLAHERRCQGGLTFH